MTSCRRVIRLRDGRIVSDESREKLPKATREPNGIVAHNNHVPHGLFNKIPAVTE